MNVIRCLVALGVCLLGQILYAQAVKQPSPQTKGVLYRCAMPGGGIQFTNQPSPGCVVLSLYQTARWRQLGAGGSGGGAWQLSIDENWKVENNGTQGWVMWNFASSRIRKLSGERYKMIMEHVSVDCHKALITIDKRSFHANKTTELTPQEVMEREEVVAGSPGALVLREFCS